MLRANGLETYDEVGLLAACQGVSSDDDFIVCEVELNEELERELSISELPSDGEGLPEVFGKSRADRLIAAVEQKRFGGSVSYALVELPGGEDESNGAPKHNSIHTSAQRIGEENRACRLSAGLTQKQLAARAGITQTVLSRVESGTGNPTLGLLEDIASALDVELDVTFNSNG